MAERPCVKGWQNASCCSLMQCLLPHIAIDITCVHAYIYYVVVTESIIAHASKYLTKLEPVIISEICLCQAYRSVFWIVYDTQAIILYYLHMYVTPKGDKEFIMRRSVTLYASSCCATRHPFHDFEAILRLNDLIFNQYCHIYIH